MTPGAGPEGYPDYQRVVNWDGPTLASVEGEQTGEKTFGRFAVSRYANLRVSWAPGGVPEELLLVTVKWFTAKTGGLPVGETTIALPKQTQGPANSRLNVRLPNLGPWVEVVFQTAAANQKWRGQINLTADNRPSSTTTPPRSALLVPSEVFKVANNAEKVVVPSYYYAGPMAVSVWASTSIVGSRVRLQALDVDLIWRTTTEYWLLNAGKVEIVRMLAPVGGWRFALANASGAEQEMLVYASPSWTGSG